MEGAAERVLLAQGREAEIFLQGDGTVLKLLRKPEWAHRVGREAAALRVLRANGMAAPEVFAEVTVDGRPGLVIERIAGVDMLTTLGRRPLSFARAARVMADLHARLHDCVAPASLPDLHDELRQRITMAPALPEGSKASSLAVLDELPRGDRLCHGDMHPGNILGPWDDPAVIDWGDASRGDPVADVARTHLLVAIGQPPPGTALVLRVVAVVGGRLLAARYLAAYRRRRPIDADVLARWEVVRAAARFAEQIEPEYPALRRFLDRSFRRLG